MSQHNFSAGNRLRLEQLYFKSEVNGYLMDLSSDLFKKGTAMH